MLRTYQAANELEVLAVKLRAAGWQGPGQPPDRLGEVGTAQHENGLTLSYGRREGKGGKGRKSRVRREEEKKTKR